MSITAIEKARDVAELSRASGQEAWRFAQALSTAGMLPREYRDKPGNVLLAMEYGRALRLPVATILTSVHVIDGRPSMSAELMQALIRRAGHRIRITGDAQQATCAIVRKDDPDFTYTATFSMDDARAAKLIKPDGNWVKYPKAMLLARATSACARQACADVLAGVSYVPEELGDTGAMEEIDALVTVAQGVPDQATAMQTRPAPPAASDPAPDPAPEPPGAAEGARQVIDDKRQELAEVDTLAARARLLLLDELTGALDAARQQLDLEALAQLAQRALEENVPELVDEARAAWMDVQADLADQEQQRGQG